jgi:hypothetical protein
MRMLISLAVFAAACGDNFNVPVDAVFRDAPIDAAPALPTAIVAAGDFNIGHLGTLAAVDIRSATITPNAAPAGAVGDDPVLRVFGGELFVVNRNDGNNVTILDARSRELVTQLATGANSNPQDVAVKGDTLYVPVYGGAGVVVLTRGSTTITTIDLSVDDPDGSPECVSAAVVGDKLYVACELLDTSFSPRGPGKVYVIDTASNLVVRALTMQTENPFGVFRSLPSGDLVIPTINFATSEGCIEKIQTGANPTALGCIVDNATAGGYISRVDVQSNGPNGDTIWWLAVTSFDSSHGTLRPYDATTNMVGDAWSSTSEIIGDVAACPDGTIAVSDQARASSGVRLYAHGNEITTSALAVGLDTSSANALVCY